MADQHLKAEEIKQPSTYGMPYGGMPYGGMPGGNYPGVSPQMPGCPTCGSQHWWHGTGHHPWWEHHHGWGHHHPWHHHGWGHYIPWYSHGMWGGYPGGQGWKRDDE